MTGCRQAGLLAAYVILSPNGYATYHPSPSVDCPQLSLSLPVCACLQMPVNTRKEKVAYKYMRQRKMHTVRPISLILTSNK